MSRLRAKCPDCGTYTAVALGPEYQCHSCGRQYGAGLVRVPRAWGTGGEAMAEAADLPLHYPETAVVEESSLSEQSLALALDLPERPLVLGGCCCAHIGAVEGLAARGGRLGLVWLDAHGDLNTPESSPSGNEWGMPLRMLIDAGAVRTEDVALIGARKLDPPEEDYAASHGIQMGEGAIARAVAGVDGVYVALDCDALDPVEITPFMPEPDGIPLEDAERMLDHIRRSTPVLGAGLSGLTPDGANVGPVSRLCNALGL
ncbi:MAG: arginase family protein [Actinobacteria bacterium]|nr:arginase family protein [Actinomycetota bacterium]